MTATIESIGDKYNLFIEEDGETVFTSFGLDKAPLIDIDEEKDKISLFYELQVDTVTYTQK